MPAPNTTASGQIIPRNPKEGAVEKPETPAEKMATLIQKMTPELARALPKHMTGDRMARIVLTAIRLNPKLAECTQPSFLGCILACATLGLEPNTPLGHAYLIPRKNNKNKGAIECTLQLGYQGMLDLAGRAGVTVYAYAVRAGDDFRYQLGMEPNIWHIPSEDADREKKPITHAYSVAVTADGRKSARVLSKAQIEARRERSPSANEGPWLTDYEAMCLKTVVRDHFKWMPKSTEKSIIAQGIAIDEAPENGTALLAAMDPAVTAALEGHGVEVAGELPAPAQGAAEGG
jgi:recombination protein RecT